jgi:hypothetical protein
MSKSRDKVIFITAASKSVGLGCALSCLKYEAQSGWVCPRPGCDRGGRHGRGLFFRPRHAFPVRRYARCATHRNCGGINCWEFAQARRPDQQRRLTPTIDVTSLVDFESLLNLNLTSTFLGRKYLVQHLRETRGAVLNMSSEVALIGQGAAVAHVATKAGQIGLTQSHDRRPSRLRRCSPRDGARTHSWRRVRTSARNRSVSRRQNRSSSKVVNRRRGTDVCPYHLSGKRRS